jgi:hypothetical protein
MITPKGGRPTLNDAERKHVYRRAPPAAPAKAPVELEKGVEQTARVVQLAYDVIGENLKQGREAAEKLRKGDYHISAVPADLDTAGRRVLVLARALSETTLVFGERLLDELKDVLGPVQRGTVPAFRDWVSKGVASAAAQRLRLEVKFDEGVAAKAHTFSLDRPKPGMQAGDLSVTEFVTPDGAKLGATVTFKSDLSADGVMAVVSLDAHQHLKGFYTGLVCANGNDVPLGALTIEITK